MRKSKERRENYDKTLETFSTWIGKKVEKISGKPFKSRLLENTPKGIVSHSQTGRLAFIFEEDETEVECFMCKLV